MKYTLDLLDDKNRIKFIVTDLFLDSLNKSLFTNINRIAAEIKFTFPQIFEKTETYKALINGPLNFHFGFIKGKEQQTIDKILERIGESLTVVAKKFVARKTVISGGIQIRALISDFSDILNLSEAIVKNYSGDSENKELPWLNWLLIRGNDIIINKYVLIEGVFAPNVSRSTLAVMKSDASGFWKVPEAYQGTQTNNWLTKTIDINTKEIDDIFYGIILKYI